MQQHIFTCWFVRPGQHTISGCRSNGTSRDGKVFDQGWIRYPKRECGKIFTCGFFDACYHTFDLSVSITKCVLQHALRPNQILAMLITQKHCVNFVIACHFCSNIVWCLHHAIWNYVKVTAILELPSIKRKYRNCHLPSKPMKQIPCTFLIESAKKVCKEGSRIGVLCSMQATSVGLCVIHMMWTSHWQFWVGCSEFLMNELKPNSHLKLTKIWSLPK